MTTNNRGSTRQSEYERSIAGAGNVRQRDDERYGAGSSTAGNRYSQSGEASRGFGQDAAERAEEGFERAREKVSTAYDELSDRVGERYDDLREQGRRAMQTTGQKVRSGARTAQDYFEANPLMIGAVGLGIGLILGALFPISRRERRFLEPIGEGLRESAVRQGAEVLRQARRGAEEIAE